MRLLIVTQYFWPENFKINDLAYKLAESGHQITVLTGFPEYPSRSFFKAFYHKPSLFANNKGINILVYLSIPSFTPENTIQAVKPIKTNCHNNGLKVDDLKLSKASVVF